MELITKYSDSDAFGSDSVFSFIIFTREVKVITIFYRSIKHNSFPSLCIRETRGSVLEYYIMH